MNKGEPFALPSPFRFPPENTPFLSCGKRCFLKNLFSVSPLRNKIDSTFSARFGRLFPTKSFLFPLADNKNGAINRISAKISVLFLFPRRSKTRRFHSGFPYRKTGVFICAKISPAAASAFSPRSLRFSVQTSARLFAFFPFPFL